MYVLNLNYHVLYCYRDYFYFLYKMTNKKVVTCLNYCYRCSSYYYYSLVENFHFLVFLSLKKAREVLHITTYHPDMLCRYSIHSFNSNLRLVCDFFFFFLIFENARDGVFFHAGFFRFFFRLKRKCVLFWFFCGLKITCYPICLRSISCREITFPYFQ